MTPKAETPPVVSRLAELERTLRKQARYHWADEVWSAIVDLERLAEMLREDGDPTCVNYVADRLAAARREP